MGEDVVYVVTVSEPHDTVDTFLAAFSTPELAADYVRDRPKKRQHWHSIYEVYVDYPDRPWVEFFLDKERGVKRGFE